MLVRAAFLIEGLRLEASVDLGGVVVVPVALERKFIGRDGREIFNAELAEHGFVTVIEAPLWGSQLWPRRKLATVIYGPAEGDSTLSLSISALVRHVIDLMAFTFGGDVHHVAGAVEVSEDLGATWVPATEIYGGGPYPGSVLARLSDSHSQPTLDVERAWRAQLANPRLALWLRLHRDIVAELSWDVRIFRAVALLETIATETFPACETIQDAAGRIRLQSNGKPYTTNEARGAAWALVARALKSTGTPVSVLVAHPDRDLWDEIEIWLAVRNAVAHEGAWQPAPAPTQHPARRQMVTDAFHKAARGDGLDAGWARYADTCSAATEVVLQAALRDAWVRDPASTG